VPPAITVEPPVITVEPAEAAEAIAPGYLWAVIIIGAVLVIALIVLIVRTRRTV
jgi:NADH:ubiquinone oxidoreductase subunit 6 (subunit J)